LELRPDLPDVAFRLAALYVGLDSADLAVPLLQQGLRYDPNNLDARINLGNAYQMQGKYADAKAEFQAVIDKDPNSFAAHYNLGLLCVQAPAILGMTPLQQADTALLELERSRALQPRNSSLGIEEFVTRAKAKKALAEANAAARP